MRVSCQREKIGSYVHAGCGDSKGESYYVCSSGVVADTDIWHKRIGHVNMQRLKLMQNKEIVTGLPKFKVEGMQKICEACQFGKQ